MATSRKKKSDDQITYHFNMTVDVDPKGSSPGGHFEAGTKVQAEMLPPHINLQALIRNGDVRPVEDE